MEFEFTEQQKDMMAAALERYVGLVGKRRQNRFMHAIEKTGSVSEFVMLWQNARFLESVVEGCTATLAPQFMASALGPPAEKMRATLYGFGRDFVLLDDCETGSKKRPGLRVALDKSEVLTAPGYIVSKNLSGLPEDAAMGLVIDCLRNMGDNMRDGELVDFSHATDGQNNRVSVLVTAADPESDLYIYNAEHRYTHLGADYIFERGDHSHGQGRVIAAAHGPINDVETELARLPGEITNLDALRNLIEATMQQGFLIEKNIVGLYVTSVMKRERIDPDEQDVLVSYERQGQWANDMPARIEVHNRACDHNIAVKHGVLDIAYIPDVSEQADDEPPVPVVEQPASTDELAPG